ncbi:MAG: type II toxin-antitoxin system VapC family toxin [Tagaea sp.]|nr:type II toxin-antitoxin system VapC family toxin [Tagaea sp.]
MSAWFASVPDERLFLSVIVLGELRKGADAKARRDPAAARSLRNWLASIELLYGERILPFERGDADMWGRMNAIRPLSPVDSMLAATAKARGMAFVTRNVRDVAGLDVELLNPFARA